MYTKNTLKRADAQQLINCRQINMDDPGFYLSTDNGWGSLLLPAVVTKKCAIRWTRHSGGVSILKMVWS